MHWLDWIIVWLPLLFVVWAACVSQKYVRGVADFLTAGRVAGRYVVAVSNGEAAMGLISVVATMEIHYQCGFAYSFWSTIVAPISMVLGLIGFCTYRFRETRAMTMGQFFEIRYCKSLRVMASIIQSVSGILNYAIFPAVGARFLIYFLDLPLHVSIFGWTCPTFALVMALFLGVALTITLVGGQVTIMVTDCVQGLLSYPMYVIVVFYKYHNRIKYPKRENKQQEILHILDRNRAILSRLVTMGIDTIDLRTLLHLGYKPDYLTSYKKVGHKQLCTCFDYVYELTPTRIRRLASIYAEALSAR